MICVVGNGEVASGRLSRVQQAERKLREGKEMSPRIAPGS